MIDLKKRTTLKTISGVAAMAATPAIATAAAHKSLVNDAQSVNEIIVPMNNGAEISIALSVDAQATIRLSNHSDKALTVKHVYPGIINAGAQSYDINSIFEHGARNIKPGQTLSATVQPIAQFQAETHFHRERYKHQRQRIVSVTGKGPFGDIVNSTRSFYS